MNAYEGQIYTFHSTQSGKKAFLSRVQTPPKPERKVERSLGSEKRFNFESRRFLILTFLIPKMPILMLKTAIFWTLIKIFQHDSLAQPSPTHPVAEYYLKRGKFQEAKPIAQQMVASHPEVQVGHNLLSIINWKFDQTNWE